MDDLIYRLKRLVELNCQKIIDPNHELSVDCVSGSENLVFEISCSQDDVGLIIGTGGRNIIAIRTLVKSACRGANVRVGVEVTNSRR